MANLELKDLFEKERLPKSNWQFISLVLYSPFGLILSLLRFFIGIHACFVALVLKHTPVIRSVVLRVFCLVLGITIEPDNKQHYDKSARVLVANCVTYFDYIALHLMTDCITPSKWGESVYTSLVPGMADFSGGESVVANLRAFIEKGESVLLLQPEETTSGKNGLLKFSTVAAQVNRRVQPVAVSVERPLWANAAPTVLGASIPLDIFWFLFSPYTIFKFRFLNVIQREPDDTDETFADKMQSAIASSLSVQPTSYTASDKAEYEKRYIDELNRPVLVGSPVIQMRNPELLRMSTQVSEVLPHVPPDAILKDLSRTWSVETTISNILEGVVQFTPLPQSSSISHSSRSQSPIVSYIFAQFLQGPSADDSVAAKSASQDRLLSFTEKKVKMIAEARQRYIEKHGLKDIL
ncbi:hypothetical protein AAG570_009464 [Ranatra chinensis]|uniref:Lipid droplet-regulating VLDL assembly factor AUP1 n=1 Tax=Ranatra chinensis TaxID=642074 RepID=A0ABD0ZA96_9HEMI